LSFDADQEITFFRHTTDALRIGDSF
jgi:hypothetical protein